MSGTIREYVRANIGETYLVLTQDGGYDGTDKPDVVGLLIDRVNSAVLADGVTEADIDSAYVKGFLADIATRYLIPVAIDYLMERTGQTDQIAPNVGGRPLVQSQTRQHYNRIAALKEIDGLLATRISHDRSVFIQTLGSLGLLGIIGVQRGVDVSTRNEGMLTQDPDAWAVYGQQFYVTSPGFGVIVVRSDPIQVLQQTVFINEGPAGALYP